MRRSLRCHGPLPRFQRPCVQPRSRPRRRLIGVVAALIACLLDGGIVYGQQTGQALPSRLAERLVDVRIEDHNGKIEFGGFLVYENRELGAGRILQLDYAVLRANGDNPRPDPVVILAGGPGQAASTMWQRFTDHWIRQQRDIVLLSQRGTHGDNHLQVTWTPIDDNQQLLNAQFDVELIHQEMMRLQEKFDLRMYSTPLAMDDLNDFRQAQGYRQINLMGGSYGTRAALVYLRQHGDSARTAILNGVAPIAFRNPLYHAREAQQALDLMFDEVENNPTYRRALPDLRTKFREVLERLEREPAEVTVTVEPGGQPQTLRLTRDAFVNSLRYQMYYLDTSRQVPVQIFRAHQGDYRPLVISAIRRNRGLAQTIALGMLFCVTAAEDVARIDPQEIEPLTRDTFLGDDRVRRQIAICQPWPKSQLPSGFDQPVTSPVPTLLLSGTLDPVTSPAWGEHAHRNLPNSLHLVVPGAHGVSGECLTRIQRQFLDTADVAVLDTECTQSIRLPPLYLPREAVPDK